MLPRERPESPIHQRINELMAAFEEGLQANFARRIGVPTGTVGDLMGKKKSKPGFDLTGKILQAYPQVSERWLLLGEGEMLKSEAPLKNNSVSSGPPPELHIDPDTSGNKRAPYINYKTAANYAGYQSQEVLRQMAFISLPPEFMKGNRPFFGFPVTGESMEPTFYTGDVVLVYQVRKEDWLSLKGEQLMVVVSRSNGIQLKRVSVSKELRALHCRSDNPLYAPFTLSLDDTHHDADVVELWHVEWRFTRRNDPPQRQQAERFSHLESEVNDLRYLIESIIDRREIDQRLRERDNEND